LSPGNAYCYEKLAGRTGKKSITAKFLMGQKGEGPAPVLLGCVLRAMTPVFQMRPVAPAVRQTRPIKILINASGPEARPTKCFMGYGWAPGAGTTAPSDQA
jgi:hypothetical protein